jgi:hypothetical protein
VAHGSKARCGSFDLCGNRRIVLRGEAPPYGANLK